MLRWLPSDMDRKVAWNANILQGTVSRRYVLSMLQSPPSCYRTCRRLVWPLVICCPSQPRTMIDHSLQSSVTIGREESRTYNRQALVSHFTLPCKMDCLLSFPQIGSTYGPISDALIPNWGINCYADGPLLLRRDAFNRVGESAFSPLPPPPSDDERWIYCHPFFP